METSVVFMPPHQSPGFRSSRVASPGAIYLPLTIEIQAIFVTRCEHHGGLHDATTSFLRTGAHRLGLTPDAEPDAASRSWESWCSVPVRSVTDPVTGGRAREP
jgi:hypothetical protein